MLKDLEIPTFPTRRGHRTYTAQFKAELVAACQSPGVSIAAIAGQHGMNANVLHRWLREFERDGLHRLSSGGVVIPQSRPAPLAAFVPIQLPQPVPQPAEDLQVKIELNKGALSMVFTWPVSSVADLAAWTAAVLK